MGLEGKFLPALLCDRQATSIGNWKGGESFHV
ncbi:hypothetical protein DSM3645_28247 [Blastopirellula marina DSM 3645]|uniref:Uncharacterized protein n=1 Tax=Blastopirellula marina DSM 3645 TaxID=314230 RepID=A3ZP75_9BACT|nr:hypothetical protein DSM3645_28247 [Blastopirellula marina DSM 3645]